MSESARFAISAVTRTVASFFCKSEIALAIMGEITERLRRSPEKMQ